MGTTRKSKTGVGRPAKYSEAEQLQKQVDHYFASITITEPVFDYVVTGQGEDGKDIFDKVPRLNNAGEQVQRTSFFENPSILSMCRFIGVCRDTLCEYEKREDLAKTVKAAKARIEEYLENQLYRKDQVTGIIFNLKNNFGWKDKSEHELTGKDGGPIQTTDMTTEEIQRQIAEIMGGK